MRLQQCPKHRVFRAQTVQLTRGSICKGPYSPLFRIPQLSFVWIANLNMRICIILPIVFFDNCKLMIQTNTGHDSRQLTLSRYTVIMFPKAGDEHDAEQYPAAKEYDHVPAG